MAKPATNPTWATDTNFASGPANGTPTKADPPAGNEAQGIVPGVFFPSQWVNWCLYWLIQWKIYFDSWISAGEEIVYPVTKSRNVRGNPLGGMTLLSKLVAGVATGITDSDADGWNPRIVVAAGAGPGGIDVISTTGTVWCKTASVTYLIDIGYLLRTGMTLNLVHCRIKPGTAEGSAAERMYFSVFRRDVVAGTITTLGGTTADSSDSEQQPVTAALGEVIDLDVSQYYLAVTSSYNASGGAPDEFLSFRLGITNDPGPRNF